MMMVLSREAVRIISGFSDEVATAVTSPLWPTREPVHSARSQRLSSSLHRHNPFSLEIQTRPFRPEIRRGRSCGVGGMLSVFLPLYMSDSDICRN